MQLDQRFKVYICFDAIDDNSERTEWKYWKSISSCVVNRALKSKKKKKMMGLDFEMGEHRRRSSILTPLFVRHFSGVKWFQTSICMSGRVWVRVIVAQRTEPEQKHTAEWQTFVRCANSMWPWTMWNKNIIKCEQANSYTTNRWRYDLYTFRLRHRALFGHCYCSAIR